MSHRFQQSSNDPSVPCYTDKCPVVRCEQVIQEKTSSESDLGWLFLIVWCPELVCIGKVWVEVIVCYLSAT